TTTSIIPAWTAAYLYLEMPSQIRLNAIEVHSISKLADVGCAHGQILADAGMHACRHCCRIARHRHTFDGELVAALEAEARARRGAAEGVAPADHTVQVDRGRVGGMNRVVHAHAGQGGGKVLALAA